MQGRGVYLRWGCTWAGYAQAVVDLVALFREHRQAVLGGYTLTETELGELSDSATELAFVAAKARREEVDRQRTERRDLQARLKTRAVEAGRHAAPPRDGYGPATARAKASRSPRSSRAAS